MNHFEGVNNQERYNNDVLNEIRKTNQLLERLISPIQTEVKPTIKKTVNKPQTRKKVR